MSLGNPDIDCVMFSIVTYQLNTLLYLYFFSSCIQTLSLTLQGNCGSCYAFASMGMLEARMRIATNNTQTPVYSPQYIVSCSRYAQGEYIPHSILYLAVDTHKVRCFCVKLWSMKTYYYWWYYYCLHLKVPK